MSDSQCRYTPPPVDTANGPRELSGIYHYEWRLVYASDLLNDAAGVPNLSPWMTVSEHTVPTDAHQNCFLAGAKAVYVRPNHDTPFEFDDEWERQDWGDRLKAQRLNRQYHVAYRYDPDVQHMVTCDLVPPDLDDAALEEYCKPLDLDLFQPGSIHSHWCEYTTSADDSCTWQGCYYGEGFSQSQPPMLRKHSQHSGTALKVLNGMANNAEDQPATPSTLAFLHGETVLWALCRKLKTSPGDAALERTYARLNIFDMDGLEDSGYKARGDLTGYECSDWTQVPKMASLETDTARIAIMRSERLTTNWRLVPLNWYTPAQLRTFFGPANMLALQILGGHRGHTFPHCDMTDITTDAEKIRHHLQNLDKLPAIANLMTARFNLAQIALHRGCPIQKWPSARNYVQPAAAQMTRTGAASYLTVSDPNDDSSTKHVLDLFKPKHYVHNSHPIVPCRNVLTAGRLRHPTDVIKGRENSDISQIYNTVWSKASDRERDRRPLHFTAMTDPKAIVDFSDTQQIETFFDIPHDTKAPISFTRNNGSTETTCILHNFDSLDTAVESYHPLAPQEDGGCEPDGYNGGLFAFVPALVPPLPGTLDCKARQPDWDSMADDSANDDVRRIDKASIHRHRRSQFSYLLVAKQQRERAGQSYDAVRNLSNREKTKWWWRTHQRSSRCEGYSVFGQGPQDNGPTRTLTRTAYTGTAGAALLLPNFPSLPYTHKLNRLAEAGPKVGPGSRPQGQALKLAFVSLPGFNSFLELSAVFKVSNADGPTARGMEFLQELSLHEMHDPCLHGACAQGRGSFGDSAVFSAPLSANLIAGTQFDPEGTISDAGADFVLDTCARFGALKGLRAGMTARYAHLSNGQDANLSFRAPTEGVWGTVPVREGRQVTLIPLPSRELFGSCITGYIEQLWGSTMASFMSCEPQNVGRFYTIFRDVLEVCVPTTEQSLQSVTQANISLPDFIHKISMLLTVSDHTRSLKLNLFGIDTDDNHICDTPTCQGQLTLAARIAEIGFVTGGYLCNAMTQVHKRFWPGFTRAMQGQRYWVRRAQEMILGLFTDDGLEDQLALLRMATSKPLHGTGRSWTKLNCLFVPRYERNVTTREPRTAFRILPPPEDLDCYQDYHHNDFFNCGDYQTIVSLSTDTRRAKLIASDAYCKRRRDVGPIDIYTTLVSADTINILTRQMVRARERYISNLEDASNPHNAELQRILRGQRVDSGMTLVDDAFLDSCTLPTRDSTEFYWMKRHQKIFTNNLQFKRTRGYSGNDAQDHAWFHTNCDAIFDKIHSDYALAQIPPQQNAATQEESEQREATARAELRTAYQRRQEREAAALVQEYEQNMPAQSAEAIAQAAQQIAEQERRRDQQPAAAAAAPTSTIRDDFAFDAQLALDNIDSTTQQLADSIRQSPAHSEPTVEHTLATVRDLGLDLQGLSATNAEKIIKYHTTMEGRKRDMEQAFEKYTETIEETKELVKRAKTLVTTTTHTTGDTRLLQTLYNSLVCPVSLEVPLDGHILRARTITGTGQNGITLYGTGMATSTDMAQSLASTDNLVCQATRCPLVTTQPFTRDRILTDIRDAFVPHVRAVMQATQPQVMAQVEDPNDDLTWPVAMDRYLSNL